MIAVFTPPREVELDFGTTHSNMTDFKKGPCDAAALTEPSIGFRRKNEANGAPKTVPQNGTSHLQADQTGLTLGDQKKVPRNASKMYSESQREGEGEFF